MYSLSPDSVDLLIQFTLEIEDHKKKKKTFADIRTTIPFKVLFVEKDENMYALKVKLIAKLC